MNQQDIYIAIFYDSSLPSSQIKEVAAGLEEEGVPYSIQEHAETEHFIELGWKAAMSSPLQVGIGIDNRGCICVHHQKLEQEHPYFQESLRNGRKLGKFAARLIKGLPLQSY